MEKVIHCPSCGKILDTKSNFCSYCGAEIEPQNDENVKGTQPQKLNTLQLKEVRWRWVLICIGMVMIPLIINMFVLRIIYDLPFGTIEGIPELVMSLSSLLMIFLSSLITALLSPGKTILEPAIATAIFIILSMLWEGNLTDIMFGWITPFIISMAGTKFGEYISGWFKSSKNLIP